MQNAPVTEDRRCSRRISITLPAILEHSHDMLKGKIIDLSVCGSAVIADKEITVCTPLQLYLKLPNDDGFTEIRLQTEVSRCHKVRDQHLLGLKFINLSDYQRYEIGAFFSYHNRFSA